MKYKIFILAFALTGLVGLAADEPKKKDDAESHITHNAAGETVVALDEETQKKITLKVEPLVAATHTPELVAYGSVIDPAPLITAQGDLASAEAALVAAQKVFERAEKLFKQDENVSRKSMEAAEADLRANQIKVQTIRRQLELEWGETVIKMEPDARQKFLDQLVQGKATLVRVDLWVGEAIKTLPKAARISVLGHEQWINASVFSAAQKTDPKVQGQGFLLRLDNSDALLLTGAAVKALLPGGDELQNGVMVPRSAVLRAEGKTWVYVNDAENKFTRREIQLDAPTDKGFFVSSILHADEKIVVEGAQTILSEEGKAQLKAD